MLFDDAELDKVVWLIPPTTYSKMWKVRIGDLVVYTTYNQQEAEDKVRYLKDSVADTLKAEIVKLCGQLCGRCCKERPKKVKTDIGVRVYHYDNSLGWQPCEADYMWQALMLDKTERELRNTNENNKE